MELIIEHQGCRYRCNTRDAKSIAIDLDFDGPQANYFGTDKASSKALQLGTFTGDTSKGGSCNVDVLTLVPHCNGTHTETISHIVSEEFWIGHAAMDVVSLGVLLSVRPVSVSRLPPADSSDTYRPPLEPQDSVITRAMLENAWSMLFPSHREDVPIEALLIRTHPNESTKRSRAYGDQQVPPFLTVEAMEWIADRKFRHLLVDFPSVDRMYDDGKLTNHHLFWNVPETTHSVVADSQQEKTITEMIYVDDSLSDGLYLLNLQVPAWGADAAPSRPLLMPLKMISKEK